MKAVFVENVPFGIFDGRKVGEGQYGRWFTPREIDEEPLLIPDDRAIIRSLYVSLGDAIENCRRAA